MIESVRFVNELVSPKIAKKTFQDLIRIFDDMDRFAEVHFSSKNFAVIHKKSTAEELKKVPRKLRKFATDVRKIKRPNIYIVGVPDKSKKIFFLIDGKNWKFGRLRIIVEEDDMMKISNSSVKILKKKLPYFLFLVPNIIFYLRLKSYLLHQKVSDFVFACKTIFYLLFLYHDAKAAYNMDGDYWYAKRNVDLIKKSLGYLKKETQYAWAVRFLEKRIKPLDSDF